MALADTYEIVHEMQQGPSTCLNVFQVERANAGESAGSISDAYQNSILPIYRLLQDNTVINNVLRIKNLGVPTDFGEFTLSGALGLRVGNAEPGFVAAGVRFLRTRNDIRNGFKRFVGVLEADINDGIYTAGAITLVSNVAAAMVANWLATSDSHIVCNYIIVKRICETTDPVTGKCLKYRLPTSDGELLFYTPTSFLTEVRATSQVSRKR